MTTSRTTTPQQGRSVAAAEAEVTETAEHTQRAAQESAQAAVEAEAVAPGPATHRAVEAAEETEDSAAETVSEQQRAEELAEAADELLLDEEARKVAAQVSDEAPYGLPGRASSERGPFRSGFALTAGGLLAVAAAIAVERAAHALLLILVAAFIAIGLDPAVRWLVRHSMRRAHAVALIGLTFLAGVISFMTAAIPPLLTQLKQIQTGKLGSVAALNDQHSFVGRLNLKYHLAARLQARIANPGSGGTDGLLHAGTVLVGVTFDTVIVLVLIVYILADLDRIKAAFYRLAPQHRRPRVGLLADEVLHRIGGYVLANLATSLVAAVGNYLLLLALGVPYALILSVLVGVLDLIPLIGSTVGGLVVAVVAMVGVSTSAAVITIAYHVFYRLLEDYVLNPRVLRRTVDVSPLVTIVAVVIGGALLGVIGALIAVPTAAAIQLYLTEVHYPSRDAQGLQPEAAAASWPGQGVRP
jgi:predicted PurR-regulated permease PerM